MSNPAPDVTAASATRRPLDPPALARVTGRLQQASQPPWLHAEVARRMGERLPVIKLQPHRVLDWGSFLGASHDVLMQRYPQAHLCAVEANASRANATAALLHAPWWSARRWSAPAASVCLTDALPAGHGQLLWSNMGLHGEIDPQHLMRQWLQALTVDGFLMFSTLGPGSLQALTALYAAQGWGPPMAPFVDMHDLGDMLVHAGFADPVMDQEQITLTWASADALLAELRQWGGNVASGRRTGLCTPRWRQRLTQLLQAGAGRDGRVALTLEVVYGHAFKPAPRPRLAAQTAVPLDDMRAMVRAARRAP
jgi:malonyl-CoA O-methyltransferase